MELLDAVCQCFPHRGELTGQPGQGAEVIDLCVPLQQAGQDTGFLVGTFALAQLLDAALFDDRQRRVVRRRRSARALAAAVLEALPDLLPAGCP